jgi:hypothetical protein
VKYDALVRPVGDCFFGNREKEEFPSALGGEIHTARINIARDLYLANLGHGKSDLFIRALINRAVLINDQMSITVTVCPETDLSMYYGKGILDALLRLLFLLSRFVYGSLQLFSLLLIQPAFVPKLAQ